MLTTWKRSKGIFNPLDAFHLRKDLFRFNPFIEVDRTNIFCRTWYIEVFERDNKKMPIRKLFTIEVYTLFIFHGKGGKKN